MRTEQELIELANKEGWEYISYNEKLSESFIEKYIDELDIYFISAYQKLSELFIESHINKLDIDLISKYQKLSESFIEKHFDKLNIMSISQYQKLSESFIEKYICRFNDYIMRYISQYQLLSESFIEKYQNRLYMDFVEDSWYYKSTEFKKQAIVNTKLYDCYDDYFVAYKGIRSDNYSKFNFQYQYFVGNIYESFADYSSDESSFGLSAWTLENAKDYCDEKIIKVKIKYEDIARIVHDNGKIRCCKFEVLEDI